MLLYKYRELKEGDEGAFSRLEKILRSQSFWCARPDTLNDDQEFSWRCDFQPSALTISWLAAYLSRERNKSFADAWVKVHERMEDTPLETLIGHVISPLIQQMRDEIGLLCLGKSPDNTTLWSRYGGDGQGICIEIDVPDRLLNSQFFEVQYTKEKIVHIDDILRACISDAKAAYTQMLLTKPESWCDEEEVRFISKRQNISVRIFDSRISGIYMGHSLSDSFRQRIESICKALPDAPEVHK